MLKSNVLKTLKGLILDLLDQEVVAILELGAGVETAEWCLSNYQKVFLNSEGGIFQIKKEDLEWLLEDGFLTLEETEDTGFIEALFLSSNIVDVTYLLKKIGLNSKNLNHLNLIEEFFTELSRELNTDYILYDNGFVYRVVCYDFLPEIIKFEFHWLRYHLESLRIEELDNLLLTV